MPKTWPDKAPLADVAPRGRDRERTLTELQLALHRLQRAGKKITLRAVAEEAGVSPPLLNNRYPDFAEQVRAIIGKTVRQQRNEKADLLAQEREKNRTLRALVDSQLVEITRLASMNEALRQELTLQKAIADRKVATGAFGRKKTGNGPQSGG